MNVAPKSPKAWIVRSIVVLPERRGVEVTFAVNGRDPVRFKTKRFGVGRRGARSAALAKFADQAGFGDAMKLYRYLCFLPPDFQGPILFGPLACKKAQPSKLRCVRPEENAA
jgi:hypothetical protein